MKLLIVNSVCGVGSTGRIASEIAREYESRGWSVRIAYGRSGYVPADMRRIAVRIGGALGVLIHVALSRCFDVHGTSLASAISTWRFIRWAKKWNPDEIWLHNLHGYYINFPILFRWIKENPGIKVRWTLHDCWSFTGHCAHFLSAGCNKWETGCMSCPAKGSYPKSVVLSGSRRNWLAKQASFLGVRDMEIITPSFWLESLVKRSFLREYPVVVRRNVVDEKVFCPGQSSIAVEHGLSGVRIVLGVAASWGEKKGLADFYKLRELLDDRFAIVLVGLTPAQAESVPDGIVPVGRTSDVTQLVSWYRSASVLFNPTKEDTYPTVNLEAVACGCPVVTYDVGGCRETVESDKDSVVLELNTPVAAARVIVSRFA